jgi:hypothetical protein
MDRVDCWVFTECGREPGGQRVEELGVCPAAIEDRVDGVNHGTNAGRACWVIAGTLCEGDVQGTFSAKLGTCLECAFYDQVVHEEGPALEGATDIRLRLVRKSGPPIG